MERSRVAIASTDTPTADASPPVTVVLYVCTTKYGDVYRVMDELHDFAAARRWTVTGSYMDTNGLGDEADQRGLQRAKQAIAAGRAELLVTKYLSMVAGFDEERDALDAWLAGHGAALHTTWRAAPTAVA